MTKIIWEMRYSDNVDNDRLGRWMRLGRIDGMTVAIITKVRDRFLVTLPNNKGDESLQNSIIMLSVSEAITQTEKHIAKYIS